LSENRRGILLTHTVSIDKHVRRPRPASCFASTCPTVRGYWLFEDASSRLHHVATGLL